jgi:hypothetical protein
MPESRCRLFAMIDSIVPQAGGLPDVPPHVGLSQLGFDSMALVSLFVELESEFGLSIEQMQHHLHRGCTLGSLLELCCAA